MPSDMSIVVDAYERSRKSTLKGVEGMTTFKNLREEFMDNIEEGEDEEPGKEAIEDRLQEHIELLDMQYDAAEKRAQL